MLLLLKFTVKVLLPPGFFISRLPSFKPSNCTKCNAFWAVVFNCFNFLFYWWVFKSGIVAPRGGSPRD